MKDYDYATMAKYYDVLEANPNIEKFNNVLDALLKKYDTKSIFDMTCGTGNQAIYLDKKGYKVIASDFSKEMIAVAQKKYSKIKFKQADMRSVGMGKFDSVISTFNAIGHLSKRDFGKAIKNIGDNLNDDGIYIFDIFNYNFIKKDFPSYEWIDVSKQVDGVNYVRFNDNRLDEKNRVMNVNQRTYIQEGMSKPKVFKEKWDMQIYSPRDLTNILEDNGFEVLEFLNMDGSKFNEDSGLFILTVARKK